jgi:beta-lactamase class A
MRLFILVALLLALSSNPAPAGGLESARNAVDSIVHTTRGVVGAAAVDLATGDTLSINGNGHFPMQSVFKFPLALAVLHRVDIGRDSLNELLPVRRQDLTEMTWSPLRESHPSGNFTMRLDSLLWYMVALSDNNVCDYFFRYCGGTDSVQAYIRSIGISDISIVATEAEMGAAWRVQYRNWSTPIGMARLLRMFARYEIPGTATHEFLWQAMAHSPTGPGRIRGLLPEHSIVAHKTGSSGTDDRGVAAATNDAGIIVLPDGRKVVCVVFVSDSSESEKTRDHVIAAIARCVWDAMTSR